MTESEKLRTSFRRAAEKIAKHMQRQGVFVRSYCSQYQVYLEKRSLDFDNQRLSYLTLGFEASEDGNSIDANMSSSRDEKTSYIGSFTFNDDRWSLSESTIKLFIANISMVTGLNTEEVVSIITNIPPSELMPPNAINYSEVQTQILELQ